MSSAEEQQSASTHAEHHHAGSLHNQLTAEQQRGGEPTAASAPLEVCERDSGAGAVDGSSRSTPTGCASWPAHQRGGRTQLLVSGSCSSEAGAAARGHPQQQQQRAGCSGADAGPLQQALAHSGCSSGAEAAAAEGGQQRQQRAGCSGADAGPQLQQQHRLKPGPVFVPVVLCMDDDDHALLLSEMHAREVGKLLMIT